MLELHEIIRVSHAVAYPMVYCLFFEWGWQGEYSQLQKNDHFPRSFSISFWAG